MVGMKLSVKTSSYEADLREIIINRKMEESSISGEEICACSRNLTYSESDEERRFTDAGVTDQQHFEKVIATQSISS
jgi:hypothetical protein